MGFKELCESSTAQFYLSLRLRLCVVFSIQIIGMYMGLLSIIHHRLVANLSMLR